mmetsp:Transcript_21103/g.40894  ORF Transcript_21103/g.40894 Transcript_21103/m.40894 type:complete len:97 (-) Transcript_21103:696-986(-)
MRCDDAAAVMHDTDSDTIDYVRSWYVCRRSSRVSNREHDGELCTAYQRGRDGYWPALKRGLQIALHSGHLCSFVVRERAIQLFPTRLYSYGVNEDF